MNQPKSLGFTLIEVMVALVIFSLISVATLASVNQLMRAKTQQDLFEASMHEVLFAYAIIFNDPDANYHVDGNQLIRLYLGDLVRHQVLLRDVSGLSMTRESSVLTFQFHHDNLGDVTWVFQTNADPR